ncbi:AraC family transcriptional regulator [Flavobacterium sufflavum]|uniref:AraC family transcriptional regulator n=1 Tax=Flavobacterium sufflavum TaxID=1921138 RepID=A0A437L2Y5_9FLAO|nr:helix-turn-helix domain-containing protein [Flavobacterium sufflavum]RVT79669.1 AraC family transcriptional regulator [Flavobacterium sufflavum]
MDLILSYIGFSQSIFAIIMILTKRPMKIASIILCVLLMVFALTFGFDILQHYGILPSRRWFLSLSLRMMCAPLLFLYTKYITKDFNKFNPRDYLHAIPSISLILVFLILKLQPENNSISAELFYEKYKLLRMIYGWIFISLITYYVIKALTIVIQFKKQIKDNYSFNSYKISLDWLFVMIILFVLLILLIIISSVLYEQGMINTKVYIFRHILELIHVYTLSIWGFHQKQLISGTQTDSDGESDFEEVSSGKYVKSGLKKEDAKSYVENLIKYMDDSKVWKDSELSIAKLASQTSISKHQLSEVLNEYLGKNFYVFVNEYRIEYAKQLLMNKEYSNWSIIAIAYECGFNSKTAFNIFFKKYTQQTPSEYKKIIVSDPEK